MTTLYVDRKDADLDLEGDTLVVRVGGERHGTAPIGILERVVLRGSSRIASRVITKLAERGVGLLLLSGRNNAPAATLLGRPGGDSALRIAQVRILDDEEARRWLSLGLVRGKIAGQARLLRQAQIDYPSKLLSDALETLDRASEKIESNEPTPTRKQLRGVEGAAAAAYFKGFGTLFAPALDFTGRNRRPPRDPVNVCLSLGYTLLHFEATRAAASHGLDPLIGIYHDPSHGRESLACDLAEPCRPLVDRWAWGLFRDDALRADSFSMLKSGACRLGKAGREVVYRSFEEEAALMRRLLDRTCKALVSELRARLVLSLPEIEIEDGPG